jgi:predicted nucleic acid-binding protein
MTAYMDSSLVLRYLLAGEETIRHALEFPRIISSELLDIECRRVFFRCRLAGELDDSGFVEVVNIYEELLDGISLIDLSTAVRQRAREAFPLNLRTLDALHLSTALIFRKAEAEESLQIFAHDEGMNLCARALGFGAPLL